MGTLEKALILLSHWSAERNTHKQVKGEKIKARKTVISYRVPV